MTAFAAAVLAIVLISVPAADAAPVAVPEALAPSASTNVTTAPAQAPSSEAQAPTAAAEAPAGATSNPFGDTGFITVQGNKFVDANCQVCVYHLAF